MDDAMSTGPEPEKKYGSLKTLTLLTFIGSGIAFLYILFTPAILNWSLKMIDRAQSSGQEMSASQLQKISDGKKAIELAQANLVPLLIIGLLATIACVIGAIWMRKLRKDGFYLYLAAEILPIIAGFILMGMGQYNGIFSMIIGLAIPIVFIILYSVNFKYLK
jgi:hypothetical protein